MSQVLDEDAIGRALMRMAHEILERHAGTQDLALVGIRTGGAVLAKRLQDILERLGGAPVPFGILDITLYRDDLSEIAHQPEVRETEIDFDVTGRRVVVVDDVLFTGRTVRCAMDALIDFGRPRAIELAVLVDRGHRELPIKADYVGKSIPTSLEEEVKVNLKETEGHDEVVVAAKARS